MYAKPLLLFSLFILMLVLSTIPVEDEPVLFMTKEIPGNAIKELDLNLERDEIAISFLELRSGESTLIQDHSGRTTLINTGSATSKIQFKQQMKIFKVKQIDALVLTNRGEHYTGNLEWLLENKKIKTVYIAENIKKKLTDQFDFGNKTTVKTVKEGDRHKISNKLLMDVAYVEKRTDYNVGGLALILKYGEHGILYMGVANQEAEWAIINKGPLNISLLKVGGFGHYFGTGDALLDHINPQVAVIFKRQGYTASDEVLTRLDDRWIEILKPNEQGIVMVKCNEHFYEITQIPLATPEMVYMSMK